MVERVAGPEIERLIQLLARLPGLGPRSARRAALHLIRKREELLSPLADAMQVARERIINCTACGNIDTIEPCTVCRDTRRDPTMLIVVETVADLWALERASALRARYHVLGGTLSPLDGVGPKDLNLSTLAERVAREEIHEVILAAQVDEQLLIGALQGEELVLLDRVGSDQFEVRVRESLDFDDVLLIFGQIQLSGLRRVKRLAASVERLISRVAHAVGGDLAIGVDVPIRIARDRA